MDSFFFFFLIKHVGSLSVWVFQLVYHSSGYQNMSTVFPSVPLHSPSHNENTSIFVTIV